mmetsp:Transcript_20869/g.59518  ORF Transcript_20869/g.59518 Transcript_20869/m.59518 type:complete len:255 (-) Transcript_20869:488-1252(-)
MSQPSERPLQHMSASQSAAHAMTAPVDGRGASRQHGQHKQPPLRPLAHYGAARKGLDPALKRFSQPLKLLEEFEINQAKKRQRLRRHEAHDRQVVIGDHRKALEPFKTVRDVLEGLVPYHVYYTDQPLHYKGVDPEAAAAAEGEALRDRKRRRQKLEADLATVIDRCKDEGPVEKALMASKIAEATAARRVDERKKLIRQLDMENKSLMQRMAPRAPMQQFASIPPSQFPTMPTSQFPNAPVTPAAFMQPFSQG